jgi:hypothetical protein
MDYINRDYSHYRKSSPQNTLQLWQTIYQINYELNEKSFIESMIEKMQTNLNPILNQNDCQKLISNALMTISSLISMIISITLTAEGIHWF